MSENDVGFYAVVPPGFNLLEAPPGELDRYGIPPKPDAAAEPGLFEFWKKLVSQPFSAEQPTFRELDTPLRGGPRKIDVELVGGTHSDAPDEAVRSRGRRLDRPERASAAGAGA